MGSRRGDDVAPPASLTPPPGNVVHGRRQEQSRAYHRAEQRDKRSSWGASFWKRAARAQASHCKKFLKSPEDSKKYKRRKVLFSEEKRSFINIGYARSPRRIVDILAPKNPRAPPPPAPPPTRCGRVASKPRAQGHGEAQGGYQALGIDDVLVRYAML